VLRPRYEASGQQSFPGGEQSAASLVLERPDDAPGADRRDLIGQGHRRRELPAGGRQLAAHLERQRLHVRTRPRRLRRALQRRDHRRQVAQLVPPLEQPEQVRDGLRPVQLAEQPRPQRIGLLVERSDGRGESEGEEKAAHAVGLPRGELRKPTHRRERRVDCPIPFGRIHAVPRQRRGRQPTGQTGV
jgi:hypothetical protein